MVSDGRGRAVGAPGLAAWLTRVAPAGAQGEVAIAIASDARVRALNARYRRRDTTTDVLSFPGDAPPASAATRLRRGRRTSRLPPSPPSGFGEASAPRAVLGDIVIAAGVARRQARAAGHSFATELKVLALHGLLHLLGHDHHDPADRGRMARLERRLRHRGGLAAGLIERAHSTSSGQAHSTRSGQARSTRPGLARRTRSRPRR